MSNAPSRDDLAGSGMKTLAALMNAEAVDACIQIGLHFFFSDGGGIDFNRNFGLKAWSSRETFIGKR